MDMDNLGPIFLFIAYMAISAWSKQRKARQKAMPQNGPEARMTPGQPASKVGSILDQLKKELFEVDEEPLVFQQEMPEFEPEIVVEELKAEVKPSFMEGSPDQEVERAGTRIAPLLHSEHSGESLDTILEPYSRVEQGILLHEILGKPRAYQDNDEWFHKG